LNNQQSSRVRDHPAFFSMVGFLLPLMGYRLYQGVCMLPSSIYLTAITQPGDIPAVRLMIASLREFGGMAGESPVWVFTTGGFDLPVGVFDGTGVNVLPLDVPELLVPFLFSAKVAACTAAEDMAPPGVTSLVWLDPACLVINPPVLFELDDSHQAAVRPVHIRNVGLPREEPLDDFWGGIYREVGLADAPFSVSTFIDDSPVRAYFNSHGFSFRTGHGLGRRWLEVFSRLVGSRDFQETACSDALHRIFLFQAVWNAVLVSNIPRSGIRLLPPDYNYPYHLHNRVPDSKRPSSMNSLVTLSYEDCDLHPDAITGIRLEEPLFSWLNSHL
jgi:hypothetical protein